MTWDVFICKGFISILGPNKMGTLILIWFIYPSSVHLYYSFFLFGVRRSFNILILCGIYTWGTPWSSGSVLDHRSLPPMLESRRGHIWRLFHLRLRFITFGGRSAHLAYYVHKSGRKTSIIITRKYLNIDDRCKLKTNLPSNSKLSLWPVFLLRCVQFVFLLLF